MTVHHKFCQKWVEISQNQCILKAEFRFGIFGFGSANLTEISVSVVSVFTRFGRPLAKIYLTFGLSFATSNFWGLRLRHKTLSTLKLNLLWQSYERIAIKVQSSK